MRKIKEIKNYPKYFITRNGKVFSFKYGYKKELKLHNFKGYYRVFLSEGGKPNGYFVHRLVAQAFIPNSENKAQVNHIDGNKQNNNINNLEWNTREENEKHKREILGWDNKGEKNGNCGYRMSKCFPSPELRNKLVELGIPRWKHNLAELGEMLPSEITITNKSGWKTKYTLNLSKIENTDGTIYCVTYLNDYGGSVNAYLRGEESKTEANARAKMLIYLIKKKLIKV